MEIYVDSLDFDTFTIIDKNGNRENINISDELMIDENNINEEFMKQSGKYAYWASLLEIVRRYYEAEQRKLETIGSQLNLTVRQAYKQKGEKPTKDMIEADVFINQNYQNQLNIVEDWSYKTKQLNYIVKAFEQRVNALTHLGAEQRKTNKNGGITNPLQY